jgi:hypothetical protein
MLNFYEKDKYIDDSIKYVSTNSVGSIVEIVKYRDNSCEVVIEYYGDNPKEIGGTNTFKTKSFDNFASAKRWSETETQQQVFFGD